MTRRDIIGRISGVILFAVFLIFHIYDFGNTWNSLDPVAKINGILITITIILFVSAYVLRSEAVCYSTGFWEKIYPLFCASLPLIIYHDFHILRYISAAGRSYSSINFLFGFYVHRFLTWNIVSMILVVMGNVITFIGLFCLRKSFSIMVEAREPVYDGIYKYIRHPIYLGEIIAIIGVLIFKFSNINVMLVVIFIAGQIIRARLEEKKLSKSFPVYLNYRQKTGFFLPKIKKDYL